MLARAGAVLVVALFAAGCGTGGMGDPQADTARGQELFTQKCGNCHALKAAGTRGTTGPNLDDAFAAAREEGLGESTIREIVLGQIRFPVPPMPDDLVTGDDAEAVAAYVASAAANPEAQAAATQATASNDPKELFQANCASCHTFADANTTGTTGPSLDQTKLDVAAIARQIANGGGGMPPFEGVLSDRQIQAVAKYIAENRRR